MTGRWTRKSMERGAYTTVAQTEDGVPTATVSSATAGDALDFDCTLDDDTTPTQADLATLPRVADSLPYGAFLVAIVELCERFAYYGLSGPLQNYMANAYHDPSGLPGALGLSQSKATALSNFFQLWCYVTPILGAVVADQYLGKYKTIKWFSIVYMVGIVVLFFTSLPVSIESGAAFPGLLTAMLIIGLGTGGIKSNVSPLIAEQVRSTEPFIKTLRNGQRVVVHPDLTLERVYMLYYLCINVGSVSAIATTLLELHVGFWSAYLLPLAMFCVGFAILVWGKDRYVIKPPQGGVIANCFRAMWMAARNGFDLEAARPRHNRAGVAWDDEFVDELRTALGACKVFLFFPVYWVTFSQMLNNFISQAAQMERHSLPNDILPNLNPLTLILLIPLLDRIIYPCLRTKLHTTLSPHTRITLGFLFASLAMFYAATLQHEIYTRPPCFTHPIACDPNHKPNEINIAWQTPAYVFIALSEALASISGLELAFKHAPSALKSFVMSVFLLTSAGGSALGVLVAPFARDPWMGWVYAALGIAALGAGGAFAWVFRGVGGEEGKGNGEMEMRRRG